MTPSRCGPQRRTDPKYLDIPQEVVHECRIDAGSAVELDLVTATNADTAMNVWAVEDLSKSPREILR